MLIASFTTIKLKLDNVQKQIIRITQVPTTTHCHSNLFMSLFFYLSLNVSFSFRSFVHNLVSCPPCFFFVVFLILSQSFTPGLKKIFHKVSKFQSLSLSLYHRKKSSGITPLACIEEGKLVFWHECH